ncbi:methyltransferase domain-containing protein [Streptomyces sp. NPDC001595]|uniref:methyltransferase domain-containing protein n=1 Tax=Streptomyces sp. NPDC001532 TaxID=3154520 RepID=UPI00331E0501
MTLTDGNPLDHRQAGSAERSGALAALFDPTTFRHLEKFGVGPGWRCWEIGAGGGTVVSWLAKRVGPTGKVVATAADASWAATPSRPPVELRVHDVSAQEPPGEGFDLVHARLVLAGVPDCAGALRSMAKALRPGGRLLVEDIDLALQPLVCPDQYGPEQQLANRLREALRRLLSGSGADLAFGRGLPRLLRAAGLRGVEADAYFPVTAPACATLESTTIRQIRAELVSAGLATAQEIDHHLTNVASGDMDLAAPPMISAWGRKP